MTRRALPPPAVDRRDGIRGALLHTLPGRAIVVGLAVKLVVFFVGLAAGGVPPFFAVVDTVAGLVSAAGLAYFTFRLIVLAKRRLLWRVRRKLILSYVFIGFVPALLLVAFSLLCGFLLFYSFSGYLVQSRLSALSERAGYIAQSTALEIQRAGGRDVAAIIAHRQASEAEKYPDISIAVVPVDHTCGQANSELKTQNSELKARSSESRLVTAGPWAHVDPPRAVPAWIDCPGFSGVLAYSHRPTATVDAEDTHLVVRGVAFPEAPRSGYAVVVDLQVNEAIRQRLRKETGVELRRVAAGPPTKAAPARPLIGRAGGDLDGFAAPPSPGALSRLTTLMDYRDWSTGETGVLTASIALSVAELYDQISPAQGSVGRTFSQGLLLVLFVIGALFLIIEAMALVAGFALAKSLTGSVHALFAGTERVRQGDFTHKIAVRSEDQLGELALSFNSMTASIEDLLRQAAEKKRLEEELRIAHEIQMSLLPQGPLVMAGLSVTALCVPAREVGGDYYDFLPLGEHRVGVLIADVSGKGTSAALYMAELKGLVLSLSEIHTSPRTMLIALNRIIANHLDARSFITMTYAVVDLRARTITYARAGHTPLIYVPGACVDGGPRQVQILVPDGMVVGLKLDNGEMFARHLVEETIPLQPGDLYLLFTDGISEAMNARDDLFGESRLGRLVETHAHLPSEELRERVLRDIAAFVGDAPQHDDMTMILLKIDELPVRSTTIDAELAELAE
ncbi:MAG TPA: SpoIIE family protein phosphatase [Vicinamibacterales bacterium]|nr:SpoIIE family protein phosphatase [Vicinamibacterales bacterium]